MNPTHLAGLTLFAGLTFALPVSAADATPERLRRADSFFGIHFDFHANNDCTNVGANTTPAMVENILQRVHPDYLQIDCKGHRGLSSYPTKVGYQAPRIVGDPLRIWRDTTAKHGVALYMHYSGVWDTQAVTEHPDWAAVNADGKPGTRATSFFGPYADKLLIPQLRELAGVYGVDGVWVDGECWASVPDYSPAALAAFRKTTGITDVPRKPSDPHWFEFLQFHREMFRKYLRHYIAEVKKTHPAFQICSNWAYTDHMAEPVSAPLDFLSGDYSPQDSVNSARLSARYLARQGKPWDLMAWSFGTKPKRAQKSAPQLQREAAVVLAMGGGFQAYFTQNRDGSVRLEEMGVMAEVATFCRARQVLCHHAQAVPQIGLLLSTTDQYRRANGLFSRDLTRANGALHALLENQWSVEVLGEHQLAGRLREYPLIVLPECEHLAPKFRDELAAYVHAGGSLLLIGPATAKLFEHELGPKLEKAFGTALPNDTSKPSTFVGAYGRGKIAVTCFNLGKVYDRDHPELLRRYMDELVRELFPKPMVEVKGSNGVDVCVARNHGKLLVHLVNTSGPHQTQSIFESIPPVGPLEVTIRMARKPAAITLEPGAHRLDYSYGDGQVRLTVPRVDIHEIIAVQPR